MDEAKKVFNIGSYFRDTGPLADEEFDDMMVPDNDEICIDDLVFEEIVV
ncbi:MAG: hypothetical protein LBQ69_05910 [Treponema sp.]|jgi:hypothetical protein|nr:hypothetical protein [Treponema sp.]